MKVDIAIVGAGFSGICCAYNLSRLLPASATVALLGTKASFSEGVAYGTKNPAHLLNVPAAKMSALVDKPDHFVSWLKEQGITQNMYAHDCPVEKQFMPRMVYADYIKDLLAEAKQQVSLHCVEDDVAAIQRERGFQLRLAHGENIQAEKVVLALGNQAPRNFFPDLPSQHYSANPWDLRGLSELDKEADVFVLGTGLTMVDTVLALYAQGHQGKITALSRRGLLPLAHAPHTPLTEKIALEDCPESLNALFRQIKSLGVEQDKQGGNWRAVIDGLRPITQSLWNRFSDKDKKRFLRHAVAYWDIHRHRIAPEVDQILTALKQSGQLTMLAGRVKEARFAANKVTIHFTGRRDRKMHDLSVDYVVNTTGPNTNLTQANNALLASLFADGVIKADRLGLGIATNADYQLLDNSDKVQEGLFALGPMTKPMAWEIIAVPDIRVQCQKVAEKLSAN